MVPIGSWHKAVLDRLAEWSFENLPKRRVGVRIQPSIGLLGQQSAPRPGLAWVARRDCSRGRPTAGDVLPWIQVAEKSLAYDGGEKADLYAAGGISDYWVVNLPDRSVQLRRDPAGGRYRSLKTHPGDDEVRPLAMPQIVLRPSILWPA